MKNPLLIAITACATLSQAFGNMTGSEMLRYCSAIIKQEEGKEITPEESMGSLLAIGYLSGFTDSHAVEARLSEPRRVLYCLPDGGVENEQLARIIQKHLKNNPESLHKSVRIEIAIALGKAFPCPDK
jgi:hypothetical protein